MEIIKKLMLIVYVITAVIIIILAMIQTKDDPGLESTVTTASTNNYASKNKAKTTEGKQKRLLIGLSIFFAIYNIIYGIIYMI